MTVWKGRTGREWSRLLRLQQHSGACGVRSPELEGSVDPSLLNKLKPRETKSIGKGHSASSCDSGTLRDNALPSFPEPFPQ